MPCALAVTDHPQAISAPGDDLPAPQWWAYQKAAVRLPSHQLRHLLCRRQSPLTHGPLLRPNQVPLSRITGALFQSNLHTLTAVRCAVPATATATIEGRSIGCTRRNHDPPILLRRHGSQMCVCSYRSSVRAQPLILVRDVESSSSFYRTLLGCTLGGGGRGHHGDGPPEYERLYDPRLHHTQWGADGLVLQLHSWEADHHHGHLGDPDTPVGNGTMLWFEVDDFDDVVKRARELHAPVVLDVHVNPNAGHRELWITDPDGYTVVIASPDGTA